MYTAIDRAYAYLMSNDNHDGVEGQIAEDLINQKREILDVLYKARLALADAANFAGLMAEASGGIDAEEFNAPWNEGGSGLEASTLVGEQVGKLNVPVREKG